MNGQPHPPQSATRNHTATTTASKMGCTESTPERTQSWKDGETVTLAGLVTRATYGPEGSNQDVTAAVKQLQASGRNQVQGGIHTAIGDPNPGVPKIFTVWYGGGAQEWNDGQQVIFQARVQRATYGPAGTNQDVTSAVQALQNQGKNQIDGGIHTAIGDPNPGVPKVFKVWY